MRIGPIIKNLLGRQTTAERTSAVTAYRGPERRQGERRSGTDRRLHRNPLIRAKRAKYDRRSGKDRRISA